MNTSEIQRRAYLLWERAGRPGGRDLEFWTAAEAQMLAERKPPAPATSALSKAELAPVQAALQQRAAPPRIEVPVTTSAPLPGAAKRRKSAARN